MPRQRMFQKPYGEHINEKTAYVLFDFTGERVAAFSYNKQGVAKPGSNWSLRDAMSLVESGNWVEISPHDEPDTAPAELDGGAW